VHTAIVGGGLTGISAAYHLVRDYPDRQVVVLEANRIGQGATCRSTGMASPGVGQDAQSLISRVGAEKARIMYQESLDAVNYVGELAEAENIDCNYLRCGMLMIARSNKGGARLNRQAKALESLGLPVERLTRDGLHQRIRLADLPSGGDSPELPAALRLPIAGTLHPGRFLAGLTQAISERGGKVYEKARVTDIQPGKPVRLTMEGGGTITADHVVLATAGFSPGLGYLRGRVLPVHLRVLVSEPLDEKAFEVLGWANRDCLIDSRRLFNYFRITPDNRIVFGGGLPRYSWGGQTGEHSGIAADLDRLHELFKATFPAEAGLCIAGGWNGVIGYTLDTLPVIQHLPGKPGVLHVGGWCGHGISLGTRSGTWIAKMIGEGSLPADLPWFRHSAPILPIEPVRWLGFKIGTRAMAAMDSL